MISPIAPELSAVADSRGRGAETPARLRVGFVLHVMQVAGAEVLVTETVRRLAGKIAPTIFCLDAVGR